ncbi:MAG: tetratricopeptide repeat protein [Cytophagales bacterium]
MTNAILYQQEGDLAKAKIEIEKASKHEKTINNPKTFYYKGLIFEEISNSNDKQISALSDSASLVSYRAYLKSIALDKPNGQYAKMSQKNLNNLWSSLVNSGIKLYQEKSYNQSLEFYEAAQQIKPKDTLAYVYAQYAYMAMNDTANILNSYKKLFEIGYKNESAFYNAANLTFNFKTNGFDEAIKIIEEGKKHFPNSKMLLLEEANIYTKSMKSDIAIQKLTEAVNKDNKNPILYFNLGVLYDQNGFETKAIESYEKAISLNPNEFDALFNLGAFYYKKAGDIIKVVNQMNASQYNKEGKKMETDAKTLFEKSYVYFSQCKNLKNNEPSVERIMNDLNIRLKK